MNAREEERRRLRRDLHDGLGPQLSSQTLMLSAVKKLLREGPETAERLLTDAITHAQEALTNVVRHSHAAQATVEELRVQEALVAVEVSDNGQGLSSEVHSGVGLSSIHERAEELGGTCVVEILPEGGTRVYAGLPLLTGHPEEHETARKGEEVR